MRRRNFSKHCQIPPTLLSPLAAESLLPGRNQETSAPTLTIYQVTPVESDSDVVDALISHHVCVGNVICMLKEMIKARLEIPYV